MKAFSFILLAILFSLMACQPKSATTINESEPDDKNNPVQLAATECIDPKKINKDAACPMVYAPVCACDGKTYSNSCVAENNGVLYYTPGKCGDCINHREIRPNAPCTREYRPVCGCNGIQYSNPCLAKVAGLISWTDGPCEKTDCINKEMAEKMKDTGCPENYDPVCGCDGKTYGNACEATRAGVTRWVQGACK